jgi:cell division protein FtsB
MVVLWIGWLALLFMNTDTPRTDAAEAENMKLQFVPGRVLARFARELERENAQLRAERDQWEQTARRLASESGHSNSDYLTPDSSG